MQSLFPSGFQSYWKFPESPYCFKPIHLVLFPLPGISPPSPAHFNLARSKEFFKLRSWAISFRKISCFGSDAGLCSPRTCPIYTSLIDLTRLWALLVSLSLSNSEHLTGWTMVLSSQFLKHGIWLNEWTPVIHSYEPYLQVQYWPLLWATPGTSQHLKSPLHPDLHLSLNLSVVKIKLWPSKWAFLHNYSHF